MNHKLLLSAAMLMAALYPAQAQEAAGSMAASGESAEQTSLSANNQFSAYPNPVTDILNINSTGSQLIESIKVYNTAGQLVATKIFRAAVESYNLNMADMPSGLYLVKMVSGKDIAVKRVMKS